MFDQIFVLLQVKRSVIISNNMVHRSCPRVAKQLKTLNIKK